jgi:hypothetical protein
MHLPAQSAPKKATSLVSGRSFRPEHRSLNQQGKSIEIQLILLQFAVFFYPKQPLNRPLDNKKHPTISQPFDFMEPMTGVEPVTY